MIPWLLANRAATDASIFRTFAPICVEVRRTSTTAAISSSPWTVRP
jgi:hypothetical protein